MIQLKLPTLRWLPAALLLLLAACARQPVRLVPGEGGDASQATRETQLAAQPQWAFSGRVAISNGGQAGNARIAWRQRGQDFDITLSAPVTRQSWRLVRQAGQVRLEGLDGGTRQGDSAEALLLAATGWRIPVDSLAAWVRGARAQPGAATIEYSAAGLPAVLAESGWSVEYRQWGPGAPPLPTRLFARQGEASVKLAIEQWSAP